MSDGNGNGGIGIGDIFSGLGDVIAAAVQELIAAVVFLAQLLAAAFTFLFNLIAALFDFNIGSDFGFLDTLKTIWQKVLEKTLIPLLAVIKTLMDWLHRKLQPIIDFLTKMRKWLDDYYRRVLRPLLNVISRIRQILQFFKLFHLKWASVLDNFLANLQNRIIANFQLARANLNFLLNWLQIVTNPNALIRRVPFLASLAQALNPLFIWSTGKGIGYYLGISGYGGPGSLPVKSAASYYGDLKQAALTGTGDVSAWRSTFASTLNSTKGEIG